MLEIWKDISWYEWLYQVSNLWNIRKIVSIKWLNSNWYLRVWLNKDNKCKKFYIHRLVWLAFIENNECKKEVNHKNWIRNDNRVENLEWNNHWENQKHRYDELWSEWYWKWKFWKDHPRYKK